MSPDKPAMLCGQPVGRSFPPFVIAELSANHNGDLPSALEIIRSASRAGAHALKFQHYKPETITIRSSRPEFRVSGGTLWDGKELFDLYAEAMTPWEWTRDLVGLCHELHIGWFSSPFDRTAVDFLEEFDIPAYKVASFELVDLPLIEYMANTGKPMVMSTGMATLEEIDRAVDAASRGGCESPILLRCNSAYPARQEEMDLSAIPFMRDRYQCEVGLSDHTIGSTAAVTSVGVGATIFEKHITTTREVVGADSAFSADADEFVDFVSSVTDAWKSIGEPRFGPSEHEQASTAFRRSLRFTRNIAAGEKIGANDVRSMRPAGGLPPDQHDEIIGKWAIKDIEVGEPALPSSVQRKSKD